MKIKLCKCGCREPVKWCRKKKDYRDYLKGHNGYLNKGKIRTQEQRENYKLIKIGINFLKNTEKI